MSQQLVSILVSAGGALLAAAIGYGVRGLFKLVKAIGANTQAVTDLSRDLAQYMHDNNTEKALMKADIQDLKDWRVRSESINRAAALGGGTATA